MIGSRSTKPDGAAGGQRGRKKVRIGDLLVQNRVISESQLQTALTAQKSSGHKLGHTLIELGFIKERQLLDFLSQQLQVPYVDIKSYQFNPEAVKLLPETMARRYRAIVLEQWEREVLVGMADPTDLFAFDELGRILKKRVRQAVVRESDLLAQLGRVYRGNDELSALAGELHEDLAQGDLDLDRIIETVDAGDAPVIRLLQNLFEDALHVKASDIHIEPEEQLLRIRQRIDGVLTEQVVNESRIAPALVQRLKLLANLDISEKRLPQDGRFQIKVGTHSVDVRLSTMPVQHGESLVMRLLDQSSGILSLDELGIRADMLENLRRLTHRPHGLVLVTGPTGSGKTTTLYAALNELNSSEKKIITVEDPVEYRLPRINQVQVHEKIGLSFARVLRTALRQDPDILLVGEMRDLDTAQIGLRAAITGHFVMSTLHTNSAVGTVSRLLDMGVPGYLLASSLLAIVAQRLVRRLCAHCSEPVELNDQQSAWVGSISGDRDGPTEFLQGRGCHRCGNTGYSGRIGIYELLELDESMSRALRTEDLEGFTRACLTSERFRPLSEMALQYAREGVTSLDEVLRITGDSESSPDR